MGLRPFSTQVSVYRQGRGWLEMWKECGGGHWEREATETVQWSRERKKGRMAILGWQHETCSSGSIMMTVAAAAWALCVSMLKGLLRSTMLCRFLECCLSNNIHLFVVSEFLHTVSHFFFLSPWCLVCVGLNKLWSCCKHKFFFFSAVLWFSFGAPMCA